MSFSSCKCPRRVTTNRFGLLPPPSTFSVKSQNETEKNHFFIRRKCTLGIDKFDMPLLFVQIIGNGSAGLPPAILLTSGTRRYLFNCGEQTQRFLTEHKLKVNKLEGIFYTESNLERLGGTSDVVMTCADNGRTAISLYGPAPLFNYLLSLQTFLYRPSLSLQVHEIENQPSKCFAFSQQQDEGDLLIEPILLSQRQSSQQQSVLKGIPFGLAFDVYRRTKRACSSGLVDSPEGLCDVVCYAIISPEERGKFDMQKARALGVPPGPLCGQPLISLYLLCLSALFLLSIVVCVCVIESRAEREREREREREQERCMGCHKPWHSGRGL